MWKRAAMLLGPPLLAEAQHVFEGVLARDPSHPRARNNLHMLATLEATANQP